MPSSDGGGVTASLPKVSVVIPTYNCAALLPAAIESALGQAGAEVEVIVVDDGSTDDTEAVVRPYLERIVFIRQKNRGLPGARNRGIEVAKGAYIALLDADDAWMTGKLERQMPRFGDAEVGVVYSDFSVRYADGRLQKSYLVNRPLAGEGYVLERYIESRFLFPSTMVFRRECFESCGVFDEEMLACEDIELFARMCLRWKVALVNEPLVLRYEGSHNITSNSEKMSEYTILALNKVMQKEPQLPEPARAAIRKELGQQYWWNGYAAFLRATTARRGGVCGGRSGTT